jgi:hypothetical protein
MELFAKKKSGTLAHILKEKNGDGRPQSNSSANTETLQTQKRDCTQVDHGSKAYSSIAHKIKLAPMPRLIVVAGAKFRL